MLGIMNKYICKCFKNKDCCSAIIIDAESPENRDECDKVVTIVEHKLADFYLVFDAFILGKLTPYGGYILDESNHTLMDECATYDDPIIPDLGDMIHSPCMSAFYKKSLEGLYATFMKIII